MSGNNNGETFVYLDQPSSTDNNPVKSNSSFEESRLGSESALVSNYPHAQANTTPLISQDNFPQWVSPPYVLAFYFLAELMCAAFRDFLVSAAYYTWSGPWWSHLIMRSVIVAGGAYFTTLGWAQWTGAYPDLWITINVGFSEMFFSKKHQTGTTGAGILARFSTLGKVLIMLAAQWPGSVIGIVLYAWSQGVGISTSDCSTSPAIGCFIAPRVTGASSDSVAMRNAFFGSLMIAASYFIAWGMLKRISLWVALITKSFVHRDEMRESDHSNPSLIPLNDMVPSNRQIVHKSDTKYVPWQINDDWSEMAKTVAVAHFAAHLIFSDKAANGFNFWIWFNTALLTGDFGGGKYFAWPGLAANLVIFVFQLIFFLLSSASATYRSKTLAEMKSKTF